MVPKIDWKITTKITPQHRLQNHRQNRPKNHPKIMAPDDKYWSSPSDTIYLKSDDLTMELYNGPKCLINHHKNHPKNGKKSPPTSPQKSHKKWLQMTNKGQSQVMIKVKWYILPKKQLLKYEILLILSLDIDWLQYNQW